MNTSYTTADYSATTNFTPNVCEGSPDLNEVKRWGYLLANFFLLVAGMAGNILTILIMTADKFRRSGYAHILISVATVDSIALLLRVGFEMGTLVQTPYRTHVYSSLLGFTPCWLYTFAERWIVLWNSWLVASLSFQRVFVLWFPLQKYFITGRRGSTLLIIATGAATFLSQIYIFILPQTFYCAVNRPASTNGTHGHSSEPPMLPYVTQHPNVLNGSTSYHGSSAYWQYGKENTTFTSESEELSIQSTVISSNSDFDPSLIEAYIIQSSHVYGVLVYAIPAFIIAVSNFLLIVRIVLLHRSALITGSNFGRKEAIRTSLPLLWITLFYAVGMIPFMTCFWAEESLRQFCNCNSHMIALVTSVNYGVTFYIYVVTAKNFRTVLRERYCGLRFRRSRAKKRPSLATTQTTLSGRYSRRGTEEPESASMLRVGERT